jgi:protein involved in temperature-dependent protein secretion
VSAAQILEGNAVVYNVVHNYKGRRELFKPHCFDGSWEKEVFWGIDHVRTAKKLGDQNDGSLELFDSEIALAFRLKLSGDALQRIDGRDEVSPSYLETNVEVRSDGVRVIKKAILLELSSVYVGAMRNTFAIVRDADKVVGPLAEDSKNFAYHGAAHKLTNALRRLDTR